MICLKVKTNPIACKTQIPTDTYKSVAQARFDHFLKPVQYYIL